MVSLFQLISVVRSQTSRFTVSGTVKGRVAVEPRLVPALSLSMISTAKILLSVESEERQVYFQNEPTRTLFLGIALKHLGLFHLADSKV